MDQRGSLEQGTVTSGAAFRTAFRATLVFLVVLTVAGSAAFYLVEREMTATLQGQIVTDRVLLSHVYRTEGPAALVQSIESLRHPLSTKLRAVGLFDPLGRGIAGNMPIAPDFIGWRRETLEVTTPDTPAGQGDFNRFYLNASRLDGLTLVVGRDLTLVEAQEKRLITALVLLGVVVSAAVLMIGYFNSLHALRKLEAMTRTLDLVSKGETTARLSVSGQNDQIDRAARAMNVHLDRLSALIATTRSNAAAIAHDLRTPLLRAFLSVERALAQLDAGNDPRGDIEEVGQELARLRSIFDAILRISRLESAEDGATLGPVALAPMLAELAETFAPLAEERGQTLALQPVAPDLAVTGDQAMLSQLVANLVQNALTHCPPGTRITLSADRTGHETRLTVADTGPGIPEGERARVFDLFYQIDPNRTGGGSGLGMALVRAIADRMGASVILSDAAPGLRVDVVFADAARPAADAKVRTADAPSQGRELTQL